MSSGTRVGSHGMRCMRITGTDLNIFHKHAKMIGIIRTTVRARRGGATLGRGLDVHTKFLIRIELSIIWAHAPGATRSDGDASVTARLNRRGEACAALFAASKPLNCGAVAAIVANVCGPGETGRWRCMYIPCPAGRCNSWHRRMQLTWHPMCCLVAGTPITHPGRAVRSTFWFAPPVRLFSSWI